MPRFNVQNHEGKWACFSTIVDRFVCPFMDEEEYQRWRIEQYGADAGEIREHNQMEFSDAIYRLSMNNYDTDILQNLREVGAMYRRGGGEDD